MSKSKKTNGKGKIKKVNFMVAITKPNGQPTFKLNKAKLWDYLQKKGYRTYVIFGEVLIFNLKNNIAYLKTPQAVFNNLLEHITKQNDDILRDCFIDQ